MGEHDFDGAKIAVISEGRILTLLRDDIPDIPYPGLWDLPGGGREPGETPEDCALRELQEELSVRLDPRRLIWRRAYPGSLIGQGTIWMLAAEVPAPEVGPVALGDEGQDWRWMRLPDYLDHPKAIPHMQARVRDFLAARADV